MLTVEVETRAPQAEAAAQENSRRAEALIKALKQALGPDDQVKTLGFRLNPVYAPKDKTGPPEIKGYQAVNRFQVKVKGPERLGAIIDLALKNGASGINGPFWEHSRPEELQRQAAVAALERARRLAEALAQSQGLKIKGVEKISTGIRFVPLSWASPGPWPRRRCPRHSHRGGGRRDHGQRPGGFPGGTLRWALVGIQ